jgi:hypothetical protein
MAKRKNTPIARVKRVRLVNLAKRKSLDGIESLVLGSSAVTKHGPVIEGLVNRMAVYTTRDVVTELIGRKALGFLGEGSEMQRRKRIIASIKAKGGVLNPSQTRGVNVEYERNLLMLLSRLSRKPIGLNAIGFYGLEEYIGLWNKLLRSRSSSQTSSGDLMSAVFNHDYDLVSEEDGSNLRDAYEKIGNLYKVVWDIMLGGINVSGINLREGPVRDLRLSKDGIGKVTYCIVKKLREGARIEYLRRHIRAEYSDPSQVDRDLVFLSYNGVLSETVGLATEDCDVKDILTLRQAVI